MALANTLKIRQIARAGLATGTVSGEREWGCKSHFSPLEATACTGI